MTRYTSAINASKFTEAADARAELERLGLRILWQLPRNGGES